MSTQIKINHRPGKASAEVFIRDAFTVGNQYTLGDGKDYGYTIKIAPGADVMKTLLDLCSAFADIQEEQHGVLKGGYNPILGDEGIFKISWKNKTKTTLWTDNDGEELDQAPALAEGGRVSVALEIWSRVGKEDDDNLLSINVHPAQIRVHELGDAQARINAAFDDWFDGGADATTREDF